MRNPGTANAAGVLFDEGLVKHLVGRSDHAAVEAHSRRYEAPRDQVVAFPRTDELAKTCADHGLTVVLASSGKEADLEWMLPAIGAEDSVGAATTSSDVDKAKPARDLLSTLLLSDSLSAIWPSSRQPLLGSRRGWAQPPKVATGEMSRTAGGTGNRVSGVWRGRSATHPRSGTSRA